MWSDIHAEATMAGFKAAAVATVASAVPTVSIVQFVHLFQHRHIPSVKAVLRI